MKRRLLNLVTVLSLLVCVAAVALWVRGYWVSDLLGWVAVRGDGGRRGVCGCSGRGGIGFSVASIPPGLIHDAGPSWRRDAPKYGGTDWRRQARGGLGFYAVSVRTAGGAWVGGACAPAPAVALAAAVLPAVYLRRRRRSVSRAGLCAAAGMTCARRRSGARSAGANIPRRGRRRRETGDVGAGVAARRRGRHMAKLKRGVFILAVVVSLPVLALALMAWRTSYRPAADGPYEGTQAIVRGGDGSFVYVVNSRRGWLTVDRMGRNSTRPVCSFPWAAVVVAGAVAPALFAVDVVKRRRAAGARGFRVVRQDAGAGTS